MDRTFHIDPDAGLVTVKLSGDLGLPDLRQLCSELAGAPDYREDLPQLIDCRGVALDRWLASCQDSAELASRRGECDCQSDCVASRHEAAFARQLSWF